MSSSFFKPVVADLDDTLCEFTAAFTAFMFSDVLRCDPVDCDWPMYNLMAPFNALAGEDLDALHHLRLFEDSGRMHSIPMSEWGVFLFENIPAREISILTARGWMKDPVGVTQGWIEHHKLAQPAKIVIVGLDECKSNHVPAGAYFVDDNVKHLEACSHVSSRLVMDRPWNRQLTSVNRVFPNYPFIRD